MSTCRHCVLYDLDATKNAKGAVLRNRTARCLWKSTEEWPASVYAARPHPSFMEPDEGKDCPCFKPKEP